MYDPRELKPPLLLIHRASLPDLLAEPQSIGIQLSPVHFPRTHSRSVSCYALFEE